MRRSPELLRFWIRSFGFEHVSLLLYFQTGHRSVTNLNAVSHGIAALLSFSRRSRFLSCDTCAVFLRGCVILLLLLPLCIFHLRLLKPAGLKWWECTCSMVAAHTPLDACAWHLGRRSRICKINPVVPAITQIFVKWFITDSFHGGDSIFRAYHRT